ncbi:MAG: ABC transporter substrate-binding protein [Candidatus Xenobia bacterium]
MKRGLAAVLVGVALLSGCTPRADTGKTVLTWSVGTDQGGFEQAAKDFEKTHPNITVQFVEMPNDSDTQHNQYATCFVAEDPTVDVCAIDVVWSAEFGSAGWATPLEDRFNAAEWNQFLPGPLATCRYKSHTYGVPWYVDAGMLYCNMKLLHEVGINDPPQTWDELVADCKKVQTKHPDVMGLVCQCKQYEGLLCDFTEFVWENGGEILDGDGRPVVDSQQNIDSLTFMRSLIEQHIVPRDVLVWTEQESLNQFETGNVVFMRNWPYAWEKCQESDPVRGQVKVVPLPHGPHGSSAATLGGWNLMISKFSRHPEEAWEFVKYYTSYENQKRLFESATILPTRTAVYQDADVLKQWPVMADFYKVMVHARPRPVTPYYSEVSDLLQSRVHAVLTGERGAADALHSAQNSMLQIRGLAEPSR